MPTIYQAIDAAIHELDQARKRISKIKAKRVRGIDEVAALKATAQAWFHTHRPVVTSGVLATMVEAVDSYYTDLLNATAKDTYKTTYQGTLKQAREALIQLRATALVVPAPALTPSTDDLAPDFSPLAGNQQMREILTRRWHECAKCVKADAHLAAIVMMGGLLEALFVARANKMLDKTPLTSATNAPKDKSTGKTANYQEWMLDSYIKVGHELGWITGSAKDVSDTLKEYRNFVHPAKELRYGVTFGLNDSSMFWQITKSLVKQLLLGA